ncbi:hypothetical protein KC216_22025, partial [Mycobacterium tuberculosis]|uniref:hypothetical protein n=1 Tax=Mycobacterium tuberculosis TaxID=1773 RepID=UPI001B8142E8
GWMFDPPAAPEREPVETAVLEDPEEEALFPGELPEVVRIAPLPLANPRLAARTAQPDEAEGGAESPPLPAKRPTMRAERQA